MGGGGGGGEGGSGVTELRNLSLDYQAEGGEKKRGDENEKGSRETKREGDESQRWKDGVRRRGGGERRRESHIRMMAGRSGWKRRLYPLFPTDT